MFLASPLHRQPDPIPPLSKDVALLKLEQKFKQAMATIERLTNEKEYLVIILFVQWGSECLVRILFIQWGSEYLASQQFCIQIVC